MKYIIMCGSNHELLAGTPRQLVKIDGERVVDRTIRLLKENGVDDIAITATDKRFDTCGVKRIEYDSKGPWINCFLRVEEPVCYIFGDVYFSPEAIETIVNTETTSVEFFASAPPFHELYQKKWAEPFAFKVQDPFFFFHKIDIVRKLNDRGEFYRDPIAWEVWQVVKGTPINSIDYTNYTAINDYTCDIDTAKDAVNLDYLMDQMKKRTTKYMIHACPKRMWYVNDYIIPSMLEQGIEESQITVYNDEKKEGNLRACMNAFAQVDDDTHGTWHLQDDVLLCSDFKTRTENHDHGIVCGFSSKMYDGAKPCGNVNVGDEMWFSFPCIRIPNQMARHCSRWVLEEIIGNPVYTDYWIKGANDDWSFRLFLQMFHKTERATNLTPNLVNHVDWIIGGPSWKSRRPEPCVSQYWTEDYLVEKLKRDLTTK